MTRTGPSTLTGPTVVGLLREAVAMARTQTVISVITIAMIAGMVLAVGLTTGRTVGAEQAVLSTIDSTDTRSIVVRTKDDAVITADVLDRLTGVQGIAWSSAFGPVEDVTADATPGGATVGLRPVWGDAAPSSEHREWLRGVVPGLGEPVWATAGALDQLGAAGASGAVRNRAGLSYPIAGTIDLPEVAGFLEPAMLRPATDPVGRVVVLIVVAERPDLVAALSDVIVGVLDVSDPASVTLTTSESLAQLRAVVQGQLGSFGRSLVLGVLAITAILASTILSGLIMLRRRDFGRRRALGAARGTIMALVLAQLGFLGAIGAALGITGSLAALALLGDPLPHPPFFVALTIVALATALAAGTVPAWLASRRDPLTELRVP